jgi:hypothetical protein
MCPVQRFPNFTTSLTHSSESKHYEPRPEFWCWRTIPVSTILAHCLISKPQILEPATGHPLPILTAFMPTILPFFSVLQMAAIETISTPKFRMHLLLQYTSYMSALFLALSLLGFTAFSYRSHLFFKFLSSSHSELRMFFHLFSSSPSSPCNAVVTRWSCWCHRWWFPTLILG